MCQHCEEMDKKVIGSLDRLHAKVDKQREEQIITNTKLAILEQTDKNIIEKQLKQDIILFGEGTNKPGILTVIAKIKSVTDTLSKIAIAIGCTVVTAIVMYFFKF